MFAYMPLIVILAVLIFSSIKILNEYERGVVFRLGEYVGVRGPGLIILIPGIEKMVKVDLRVVTMDVPSQDIITKDNVTLKVNGVVYFRVNNPQKSIIHVENFITQLLKLLKQLCVQLLVNMKWMKFYLKEKILTVNFK